MKYATTVFLILSLVLTACAPEAPTTPTETPFVIETEPTSEPEPVPRSVWLGWGAVSGELLWVDDWGASVGYGESLPLDIYLRVAKEILVVHTNITGLCTESQVSVSTLVDLVTRAQGYNVVLMGFYKEVPLGIDGTRVVPLGLRSLSITPGGLGDRWTCPIDPT